ncbi:MAG: class I SAM-dependent methyltransferase [Steroidobacteraceae bacterium]
MSEAAIIDAWSLNATPWVAAVRERQIESRRLATDQAIVDAVAARSPRSVLDVGCGEGWLARALAPTDTHVLGIDAIPGLIECARCSGGGDFRVMSFEDIAAGRLKCRVDAAVCNFSLFGNTSVRKLLAALAQMLNPGGAVLIQTLHPVAACGDLPYQDGWREGSWAGFSADFSKAAPWYFRTLASWIGLLNTSGLPVAEVLEPMHPDSQRPASIIFIAKAASATSASNL